MRLKRTPLKSGGGLSRTSSSLKKSGNLKSGGRIKTKPKTEEQKEEDRIRREKDFEFYSMVWDQRPHYCQECGRYLGEEMKPLFMDHLLEKNENAFPHLRYEIDNIFICCGDDHNRKTNGFPGPKHQLAIEEAKRKFL